jgi:uncharacterized protein (TIGR00106 family)
MAIIELSVNPIGTGTPSVSRYVARAVAVLAEEKNIKYETTPMGTIIEGDLGHLLTLAQKMHETVFEAGAKRIVTVMKIDDRRDKSANMSNKVESLKRELER